MYSLLTIHGLSFLNNMLLENQNAIRKYFGITGKRFSMMQKKNQLAFEIKFKYLKKPEVAEGHLIDAPIQFVPCICEKV